MMKVKVELKNNPPRKYLNLSTPLHQDSKPLESNSKYTSHRVCCLLEIVIGLVESEYISIAVDRPFELSTIGRSGLGVPLIVDDFGFGRFVLVKLDLVDAEVIIIWEVHFEQWLSNIYKSEI